MTTHPRARLVRVNVRNVKRNQKTRVRVGLQYLPLL
jgi:hypothetical protein